MSLKVRINEDMKAAMRARESARLSALRLLLAAIKQREVDERIELDDAAIVAVVDKMLKQRRDSVTQYEGAQRFDLANAERFEIEILNAYKPQGLSTEQIASLVDEAISTTGATRAADMGKLMAVLKPQLAGKADMAEVSRLVKARLTS
ncbi:GatB/YqeY domain-containing protein [Zoogloea sp.]|uniref:GatB/YqeY domain-containing protein n=1 Tax=Zoogloea sp. TaxID=49181 RepID=UPI00260D6A69|nr:GatB/YqeY domain-containing protein [Zoogloea sp.]MDD3354534.1 GatB/YqeY domain-containing protein [Zoogloea sp.]